MSKVEIGTKGSVWPMPVLIVAAYDEEGVPNAMNAAWGQMCATDKIAHVNAPGLGCRNRYQIGQVYDDKKDHRVNDGPFCSL